jgi:hypothetical protein
MLSTADILVLTNWFRSAAFDIANIIYFYTKQVTLMGRLSILSLPLQLVFLVQNILRKNYLKYFLRLTKKNLTYFLFYYFKIFLKNTCKTFGNTLL